MKKTLLLFLTTFLVILVSGQPPDMKIRINAQRETILHQRKSGFEQIKNSLEVLNLPKQDQRLANRLKSQHTTTQQLDSVHVSGVDSVTGEMELESKFDFIYNSANQLILETAYFRDVPSGQWIFGWRDSSSYDTAGNLVGSLISVWDISTEEWVDYDREEYIFDDEGNEIQTILYLWDQEAGVWDSLQKNNYIYENGNQVEEIQYAWLEIEWEPERKLESQYDTAGNLIEDIEYLWNGSEWIPDFRNVNTFDTGGNLAVGTFYEWDASLESWVAEWKYEITLDDEGNQSMLTYSQFNTDTDAWETYWRVDYTYDVNSNLAEEISYSIAGEQETPEERYEYIVNTDFTSEEILSPYGFSYILLFNNMLTNINVYDHDGNAWVASSNTEFFYNPYEAVQYSLTIDIAGNGSVNVNETTYTEPVSFNAGTEVSLEAVADEGWEFVGWTGDIASNGTSETIMIDGNKNVTATFTETAAEQFTITITIEGEGSVNVNGEPYTEALTFDEGTELTLEALAAANYTFVNWSGDLVSNETEAMLTMDGNKVILATFEVVSSTEEINANLPSVYPNPFSSNITIRDTEKISFVTFINLIGRTVKEVNLEGSGTRYIPTGDLDNGIYMLIFHGINGDRTIMKMVKN